MILRLVRRPDGLHAIGPQDHAIIQTDASHKARGLVARRTGRRITARQEQEPRVPSSGGDASHVDGTGEQGCVVGLIAVDQHRRAAFSACSHGECTSGDR